MTRKGRRGRAGRGGSVAQPQAAGEEQIVEASEPEAPPPVIEAASAEPPPPEDVPVRPRAETPVAFATTDEAPPEAEVPHTVPRDDSSYPPVDLDNHFFDGHSHSRPSYPPVDAEERDPRMALKLTPEVARRRADLSRYVKFAVAAASALCLAALVKVAVAHNSDDSGTVRRATTAAALAAPVQAPVQPVVAPTPTQAAETPPTPPPVETQAAAVPATPPPVETAAAAVAPPADTATAAPAPTEAPELDPKAAAKEKNTARTLLERGKNADAIEAGERSVALDPTDGEAWLILGAAYQEKGDMKNARRSYKACLEQGKRGPKYECAAMPH
jgi:Flp pilus assembly protein TadD